MLDDDPRNGLDVNHEGGFRGFVKVRSGGMLHFPDHKGNKYFNTLGNKVLDDRAGFQFLDFDIGDILSLTGRAEIELKKRRAEWQYRYST